MILLEKDITSANLAKELQDIVSRLKINDICDSLFFPKYFQIETTRLCNACCPFCPSNKWDKSVPFMNDELFEKIVSELSEYSAWIEFVAIQRAGEPLMDKKIIDRVSMLKEINIKKVCMSTNASLLSKEKSVALLEAGLDEIMFSIDSVVEEEYKKMRVGLNFGTVLNNIRTFFKLRDKINPNMFIRVRGVSFHDMKNKEHLKKLEHWENFWSELKKPQDRIYLKLAHNWGNQKKWAGHTPEYEDVYHPCIIPWSTMHISAMGIVPLCPQDYDAKMNIGDINVDSIKSIWQGENWNKIRSLHMNGKRNEIPFCEGCKLFDLNHSIENWQEKQLYDS